ncbi:unnamed protein product [Umbelopsis sp. WA50703]
MTGHHVTHAPSPAPVATSPNPGSDVPSPIVDDVELLAILNQPDALLLSPSLPELQSDNDDSEFAWSFIDSHPPRKRSRDVYEDEDEDDEDPLGFEFLDVVQLEDTAPLAKKPFVDDAELSLDFLNDFDTNSIEVIEPFTA